MPRSTLYYRPQDPPPEEAALRGRLRALAEAWPRYGYRRLTALLRGEGFQVGERRVRSLLREEGFINDLAVAIAVGLERFLEPAPESNPG